jgi:hypothetical protein
MRRALIGFSVTLVALAAACANSLRVPSAEGSFGEILNPNDPADQWRYAPAPNVRVMLVWKSTPYGRDPWAERGRCVKMMYVVTDANGHYRSPSWWAKPVWPPAKIGDPRLLGYGSGFARELWIGDKHPAPYEFTSVGARDLPESEPLTGEDRVTPEQLTGCKNPPDNAASL